MIKFRLQVYYCCWEELMQETTAKFYPAAEVELDFFGNSRHHHESCPVYLEIQRRSERRKQSSVLGLGNSSDFNM
jgi:hypothetical protein